MIGIFILLLVSKHVPHLCLNSDFQTLVLAIHLPWVWSNHNIFLSMKCNNEPASTPSKCNMWTILPEVIQIIPAIETKSQGVFLKTQGTEKLPYSLWCTLEDRHLHWDRADTTFTKNQKSHFRNCLWNPHYIIPLSPSCSLFRHVC